ncbi:MAG: DUF3488 domain-containing protein [Myxococcales bacterium]|nr:DUF3488 domain-containing protein [Myxococcales bacterium]
MRFDRLSRLVTYLLVATSLGVLILSGELGPAFTLIFGPLFVLSIPVSKRGLARGVVLWNTVLVLGLLVAAAFGALTGDWLRYAIYFASLMVTAKLFQQRNSGDFFQLYVLSFLQLVAGAVINPSLSFAVAFLAYVVLLTWALLFLQLRRNLESIAAADPVTSADPERGAQALMASPRLSRLVTPRFLGVTSALALGLFTVSILVFLLFPRLGLGFFGSHRQSGQSVSGFDDQVELGGFGNIKSDETIVMRIESDTSVQSLLPLRLRGIAFDRYDGNTWSKAIPKGESPRELVRIAEGNFFQVRMEPKSLPDGALRYDLRVYMEPLRTGVKTIFGEHRVVAVRDLADETYTDYRRRTKYRRDNNDDVLYESASSSPARYIVRSIRYRRDAAALRGAGPVDPVEHGRYLQLPGNLDPRIKTLAEEITRDEATPFDKAGAIERHLLANYTYSLDGGHDDVDPLADFLFGIRKGHCEYFSTAFVILARAVGIPARSVGGFYGGIYNSVGDYVAMRQADAHSWAEVLYPGEGWEVYDATPPSGSLVEDDGGFFAAIGSYIDSMQLAWYKWVIRYDLDGQLEFFKSLGRAFGGSGDLMPNRRAMRAYWKQFKEALPLVVSTAVALVLVGILVVRRWRRRKPVVIWSGAASASKADLRVARRLYARVERAARKRGVEPKDAMTPGRLLGRLRAVSPYAAEQAEVVVSLYERVVFGGAALSRDDRVNADAALVRLTKTNPPALERATGS